MGFKERDSKLKEIRREDIINAAEKIFFRKGFYNASMDEIAKEAEYSKRTIYIYFESKEHLYQAIIKRAYQALNRISKKKLHEEDSKNGYQKLTAFGEAYIEFIQTYPDYFKIISNHHFGEAEFEQLKENKEYCGDSEYLFDLLITFLRDGVNDGSVRADIDVVPTAFILNSNMVGIGNLLVDKELYLTKVHNQNIEGVIASLFNFIARALVNKDEGVHNN